VVIPSFQPNGLLPPGDYEVSFDELRESVLTDGPRGLSEQSSWDSNWRRRLVNNLEILSKQLWQVGVREVYVDGSFAEDKDHPNDIDGYFECDARRLATGDLQRELNALDPYKIWTWDPRSRQPYANSAKRQLPMWHRYRVELYPHFGQTSKILDQFGNELQFPSAFRMSRREHKPKGIIHIISRS